MGKKFKLLGLEFGERLRFRRTGAPGKLAKMETVWEDGVFLGYRASIGETVVDTVDGVFRARTLQRRRWSGESLQMVMGTPWIAMPGKDK